MSQEIGSQVAQLLNEGKYNLPVFLRYLKSFVTGGEQPDKAILLGILLQSLARFHTSDFTACMCLVASHVQDSPAVDKELNYMYELENLLSCSLFTEFWKQWSTVKEHLPESFHFETRVRASILEAVSNTMDRISAEKLSSYLAVAPDQVGKVAQNAAKESENAELKVVSCEGGEVVFQQNRFNYPQAHTQQEALGFADVASMLPTQPAENKRANRPQPAAAPEVAAKQ